MATKKKTPVLAPGMQWINPYLFVKNPEAAIAFYKKAFGFKLKFSHSSPDGKIRHAELTHETGVVMLGPESADQKCHAPSTLNGSPVTLYVYASDVDKIAADAGKAGGIVVTEPADQFYGDRTTNIIDPEGHSWCFAKHVKTLTPAELQKAAEAAHQ